MSPPLTAPLVSHLPLPLLSPPSPSFSLLPQDGLYYWPDGRPLIGRDGKQISSNSAMDWRTSPDGFLLAADGTPVLDAAGNPVPAPKRSGAPWGFKVASDGKLVGPTGKTLTTRDGRPIPAIGKDGVPLGCEVERNGFITIVSGGKAEVLVDPATGKPVTAVGYNGLVRAAAAAAAPRCLSLSVHTSTSISLPRRAAGPPFHASASVPSLTPCMPSISRASPPKTHPHSHTHTLVSPRRQALTWLLATTGSWSPRLGTTWLGTTARTCRPRA